MGRGAKVGVRAWRRGGVPSVVSCDATPHRSTAAPHSHCCPSLAAAAGQVFRILKNWCAAGGPLCMPTGSPRRPHPRPALPSTRHAHSPPPPLPAPTRRTPRPERNVKLLVVSDGERVGDLGDLGVQAVGVPMAKIALYTAAGGLPPSMTMPVIIDVGTDNGGAAGDAGGKGEARGPLRRQIVHKRPHRADRSRSRPGSSSRPCPTRPTPRGAAALALLRGRAPPASARRRVLRGGAGWGWGGSRGSRLRSVVVWPPASPLP